MRERKWSMRGIRPEEVDAALAAQEDDANKRLALAQMEVERARGRLQELRATCSQLGEQQARLEAEMMQALTEAAVPVKPVALSAVLEATAERTNLYERLDEMCRLAEAQREAQAQLRREFAYELLAMIGRFATDPAPDAPVLQD